MAKKPYRLRYPKEIQRDRRDFPEIWELFKTHEIDLTEFVRLAKEFRLIRDTCMAGFIAKVKEKLDSDTDYISVLYL